MVKVASWANRVDGEDVGVSGSGACQLEGCLVVLLSTVNLSLPWFEYFRRILVVTIKYSCCVAAEF